MRLHLLVSLLVLSLMSSADAEAPKFDVLFNGKDLSGWKGVDGLWSVQDGTIVGQTTIENPIPSNTFLVWQGGEVGDFEFRCRMRVEGNNSGVQYRSEMTNESQLALKGYQADLHPKINYFGMMYGEKTGRGIIANAGQRVTINADNQKQDVVKLPALDADLAQWNELRIIAVGDRMIHQVNGVTTLDLTDRHPDAAAKGLLGLQLHRGRAMRAEFRDLMLRPLSGDDAKATLQEAIETTPVASAADKKTNKVKANDTSSWIDAAPKANWIWSDQASRNQKLSLRRDFELTAKPKQARLYATCDDRCEIKINGKRVGNSKAWGEPIQKDVTALLKAGKNRIDVKAQNNGGAAGFVLKLMAKMTAKPQRFIVTDRDWQVSDDTDNWQVPKVVAKLGDKPWGIPQVASIDSVASAAKVASVRPQRLNPASFELPPGFVAERILQVRPEWGSWVSLATDPKGRIYACDQQKAGLYRITLSGSKDSTVSGQEPLVEKMDRGQLKGLSGAQGLAWAFDSLWFHQNGGHLYRLTDSDGDDLLDTKQEFEGGIGRGEHGNHAVMPTEDGQGLYLVGGNSTPLAELAASQVPTWNEGLVLPRMWDARGHARGRTAPGGWITRLDPNTGDQTLVSMGYRNQYDIALNAAGDLFTYDADMEWDLGLPWYRPTRICFATSGSDYGWRSGSGKWKPYFEDSLPPVVEIGPGSPTGLVSGMKTHFPSKYRDALFALDWTFGTIYSIHISAVGAGYEGTAEPFVRGTPLPVTDAIIDSTGSLVFAVGGRGIESAIFRVRYVGQESTQPPAGTGQLTEAVKARRQLERFHGVEDASAIETAWPYLSSKDRFLRFAARVAIESQSVEKWASRALGEDDSRKRAVALVGLARMGRPEEAEAIYQAGLEMDVAKLDKPFLLALLRAYGLAMGELNRPSEELRLALSEQLDPMLPNPDADINHELVRLLVALRAESVITKTLELITGREAPQVPTWSELASLNPKYGARIKELSQNPPPTQAIGYAFMLRNLKDGWSLPQRREYFDFLNTAAKASGGASYPGYLQRIRDEALGNCSDEQRKALEDVTGENFNPQPDFEITQPEGPGQEWTVDAVVSATGGKADFNRGRSLFFSAKCASCHRLGGLGGNIGPDLTSVPSKFRELELAEAIVLPSKAISDQYSSSQVLTVDGELLTGLVIEQTNGDLLVYPIADEAKPIEVAADDIEEMVPSRVSQMPPKLLDSLNAQEVRDLMTYLLTAGNPEDKRFK